MALSSSKSLGIPIRDTSSKPPNHLEPRYYRVKNDFLSTAYTSTHPGLFFRPVARLRIFAGAIYTGLAATGVRFRKSAV
jgi:hypothetical protein